MPSACRAASVLAPPTFWSPHVFRWLRRRFARDPDILFTTCSPLAAPAVCSPRCLSVPSVPSARHAGGVLGPTTFRSPLVFRRPPRGFARLAVIPFAPCHPVAKPEVCSPRCRSVRSVPYSRRAAGILAPLTLRSPRATPCTRRRCARPGQFPVATCHQCSALSGLAGRPRRPDGILAVPSELWTDGTEIVRPVRDGGGR
jgi:hypothetical protein